MAKKQKFQRGDLVRITNLVTPYGVLAHAGEIGVITKSHKDSTWYHHVWFGPFAGPLASAPPGMNWRGYDEEHLEAVTEFDRPTAPVVE